MTHIPVMTGEIIEIFAGAPDGIIIDATFGLGGHSVALYKSLGSKIKIIGIDADSEVLAKVGELPEGITVRNMRFSELPMMIQSEDIGPVSGILFDLGLNSAQLDDPSRGFSFSHSGPIDMRFDRTTGITASQVIRRITCYDSQGLRRRAPLAQYCPRNCRGKAGDHRRIGECYKNNCWAGIVYKIGSQSISGLADLCQSRA